MHFKKQSIQIIDSKEISFFKPMSGRVVRASATEADSGSIPDRVKPKIIEIDSHSLTFSNEKEQNEASTVFGKQVDRWQSTGGSSPLVPSLSPCQDNTW